MKNYERMLDEILKNKDTALSRGQVIDLLESVSPPFCQYRSDCVEIIRKVLEDTKRLEDVALLKRVYCAIALFADDVRSEEKIALLQEGIRLFDRMRRTDDAADLCFHIASSSANVKTKRNYCAMAMERYDKHSEAYACALALSAVLASTEVNKDILYCAFGGTVYQENGKIVLPSIRSWTMASYGNWMGFSGCPVLKGHMEYAQKSNSGEATYDEHGAVKYSDEVWYELADSAYSKNYRFQEQVGIVYEKTEQDGKGSAYELVDFRHMGGEGLLPLAVGNIWIYRQLDCPTGIKHRIQREIIAQTGNRFVVSGYDYYVYG